jgi:hypothetical protein
MDQDDVVAALKKEVLLLKQQVDLKQQEDGEDNKKNENQLYFMALNFYNSKGFMFLMRLIVLVAALLLILSALEHYDSVTKDDTDSSTHASKYTCSRKDEDLYTLFYKGRYYRTVRPNVPVDAFSNKYLENERLILQCPIRFPMPEGYELIPDSEKLDIVKNVISKHFWSSSALIVTPFAAYPTLSLLSQMKRPYPPVAASAQELQLLTAHKDPFKNMGNWFTETGSSENGGEVWLQQNLLPVNTRECLLIIYSFAARGFRDDNVEDIVPACELCSANILVRSKSKV